MAESKSEYSRQLSARNNQSLVSSGELINGSQTAAFKDNFRKISSRFRALGVAVDVMQTGSEALPVLEEITAQQQAIFSLCLSKPALMPVALDTQADLLDKARDLLHYLYALILDGGIVQGMKPSDRRLLFGHVL
ncbi:MAG: hypothetical protein EOP49_28130, partial [Sphingobacteriales bacterium]